MTAIALEAGIDFHVGHKENVVGTPLEKESVVGGHPVTDNDGARFEQELPQNMPFPFAHRVCLAIADMSTTRKEMSRDRESRGDWLLLCSGGTRRIQTSSNKHRSDSRRSCRACS